MAVEKSERLTVRFSPESLSWIKAQAEKASISPSRFVREVALGKRSQDGQQQGKDFRLKQILQEISPIGNNMNQIAKKANETNNINTTHFEEARDELIRLEIKILEELQ